MLGRVYILSVLLGVTITTTVIPAFARPDERGTADAGAREKSRAAFRRGVAQLRVQDWAAARASFEEAWSLVQHPSILLNLGIARLRTDDPVLAEQDLVRFLSEDSAAAPEELASARDALAEARAKVGTLRIVAIPASSRIVVDGKPVAARGTGADAESAEVRVKAGKHTLAASAEGFISDERSVNVPAKSETDVKITLAAKAAPERELGPAGRATRTPPPPPPSGSSTRTIVGWSLAGVGGAALLAGGAMALHAASLSSDYGDRTSPSFQNPDVKDEGIAFRTGADVGLVVGVLAGVGAAILLLTDLGAPSSSDAARRRFGLQW